MTYDFAKDSPIDRQKIRERFRKMTDEELRKDGQAAAFMCSAEANFGKPPRECFVIQLEIAREVWRERLAEKRNRLKAAAATQERGPNGVHDRDPN